MHIYVYIILNEIQNTYNNFNVCILTYVYKDME